MHELITVAYIEKKENRKIKKGEKKKENPSVLRCGLLGDTPGAVIVQAPRL